MKPEWRTSTVVQLCQSMRETQDYSALPILADALEDAGCDDEKMLGELRGRLDEIESQRQTAIIYSDESAEAVKVIENFCDEIGGRGYEVDDGYACEESMGYADMMKAASRWANDGEYVHLGTNESYKGMNFDAFWDSYELITGKPTQFDEWAGRHGFFSCGC